jgi:hypothetical protein
LVKNYDNEEWLGYSVFGVLLAFWIFHLRGYLRAFHSFHHISSAFVVDFGGWGLGYCGWKRWRTYN